MAQTLSHANATLVPSRIRWSGRRLVVTLGVVALLAWAVASLGDGARLIAAALGLWARLDLLALFLFTYTAAFALRALAWKWLLPAGPSTPRLFAILQIALFANHLFPTKAGEIIRVGLLARSGVPIAAAATSTALARLLDFAALGLIAIVLGPFGGSRLETLVGLLAVPIAAIALGALGCLLLAAGALAPLYSRLPTRFARIAWEAQAALAAVPITRVLAAFAFVVPSWLLEAGALWATAHAAGVPISVVVAAGATAFTIAFQAFQVTPGGIGVYEASLTGALALAGVDPATGLVLAVATHALKFAYSYLAGFLCLIGAGVGGLGQHAGPHPDPSPSGRVAQEGTSERASPSGPLSRRDQGGAALTLALSPWERERILASQDAISATGGLPRSARLLPGRSVRAVSAVIALGVGLALIGAATLFSQPSSRDTVLIGISTLGGVGAAALVFLIARQWWPARHPLRPPGPVPPGSIVAVLIPVHDEAPTISAVVSRVPRDRLQSLGFETRVIVVDDGSTDASGELARAAGADLVVAHPEGRGLGAAVRTGLAAAAEVGAAATVYLDGDGEYDPADIPAVVGPVLRGEADYVLGTRFPRAARLMRPSRRWGNLAFTVILSLLTGRWLRDAQTGFRAFSRRALSTAEIIHDYNYAQVLTLDLLRKRMRLTHVPIDYRVRKHGRSFIRYREYFRRVVPAIVRELLRP